MPKRIVAWGVLLFSFAIISLGYLPEENGFSAGFNKEYLVPFITIPVLGYRIMGAIAVVVSLCLVISAFWGKWSNNIEEFVIEKIHYLLFVIYWIVYIMGYLKGINAVISNSPPAWVVYLVFYPGFILFLLIPVLYVKWLFELKGRLAHAKPK